MKIFVIHGPIAGQPKQFFFTLLACAPAAIVLARRSPLANKGGIQSILLARHLQDEGWRSGAMPVRQRACDG